MSLDRDRTHTVVEADDDAWHGQPYECDNCGKPANLNCETGEYEVSGYCPGMKPGRLRSESRRKEEKQQARALGTELQEFVRDQGCILVEQHRHTCKGRVVAHHIEHRNRSGDWVITNDYRVVPNVVGLCAINGHKGGERSVHEMGRTSFEREWGVDLVLKAREYLEMDGCPEPPEHLVERATLEKLNP